MAPKAKKSKETLGYDDDSVLVQEGLEAIRKQSLDMYVGGKDTASFHLVKEVVDNSVDEAINKFADTITAEYFPKTNMIVIEDNGRGLPTGMNQKLGKTTIEVLFTHLHAGGKFNKGSFKVSGGKNGVGVKATNALSSYLLVESFRDGEHYSMEFSRGHVVKPLKKVGSTKKRGTRISFIPDTEVLGEYAKLDPEMIKAELEKRTFINAGLTAIFKMGKEEVKYYHENGIEDYLNILNPKPMTEMVGFEFNDKDGNMYQVVFNYANAVGENIKSFVNGIVTNKGTHETGFKTGLTTSMLDFIRTNNLIPKKLDGLEVKGEDIREGLFAIINLRHTAPQFKGQVKDELSNTEVMGILKSTTHEQMSEWLNQNPDVGKRIANRIIAFAKGRKDAAAVKDKIVKVNSGSSGLSFMASFTDCSSRDITKNELIVIEGKSAGGNVRNGRNSDYQAVFPLRGKPKNTYGVTNASILSNNELKELIKVIFGTTDLKNLDYDNIRYGKISILADADDDGYHIVCLLLAFFWEHCRQLILDGRVCIILSPLYRVNKGGKFEYFKNDKDYDKFIVREIGKKYDIKEAKLSDFIVKGKEYISKFNLLTSRYSIDKDVLNLIENYQSVMGSLTTAEMIDDLESLDLEVSKVGNTTMVEGLFNDIWHNLAITDKFISDVKELSEVFTNLDVVTLVNKKTGEELEDQYIYDVLQTLNSSVKYERQRFKGLGEADHEELTETTLDPNKRDEIKVLASDAEKASEHTKLFFGSNADLRKDFINQRLA
jgi:DNA gyrase subunit B